MEVLSALLGAVVGFLLSTALWIIQRYFDKKDRLTEEKRSLVYAIIRTRMNNPKMTEYLNEIPITFGDNEEILNLYRLLMNTHAEKKTEVLTDLLNTLIKAINPKTSLRQSDITNGLTTII
ncbi:DUF6680 family protein [Bifidobacterium miconis]|uniref:DUF6680 family protein n=1 Tax=Bifidobacterium miconis TaxID=2834435 RepID=UPI003B82D203